MHEVVRFGAQGIDVLRRRIVGIVVDGVQVRPFHAKGYVEAVVIGPEHLLGLIANGIAFPSIST